MLEVLKERKVFIVMVVLCISSAIVFALLLFNDNKGEEFVYENVGVVEANNEVNNGNSEVKPMFVYIVGEVVNPGVYSLNDGERIVDVLNKCGGAKEEADLSKVNLAYKLLDGQKIIIPNVNENVDNNFAFVINNAGNNIVSGDVGKVKVNINVASQQELESINGVGASTAKKIIDYREKNGYFKSVEDLTNVSGIGKSKVESIREFVVVK